MTWKITFWIMLAFLVVKDVLSFTNEQPSPEAKMWQVAILAASLYFIKKDNEE